MKVNLCVIIGLVIICAGVALMGYIGDVLVTAGAVIVLVTVMVSEYRRERKCEDRSNHSS